MLQYVSDYVDDGVVSAMELGIMHNEYLWRTLMLRHAQAQTRLLVAIFAKTVNVDELEQSELDTLATMNKDLKELENDTNKALV